jgi:hypothetical protein
MASEVASALALIGATASDAKTVTACSAEVSDSNHTAVILRIAPNQRMQGRDISKLQKLVDGLMREISQVLVWHYSKPSVTGMQTSRIPTRLRVVIGSLIQ